MDEPFPVNGVEPGRDLGDDAEHRRRWERAFVEEFRQADTVDVAGGEIRVAVCLARVQDRHEVRVRQPARDLSLTGEAAAVCLVRRELVPQDLERDDPPVGLVHRLEDDAHSSFAQDLAEAVRA